jgi:hypothetical protein
MCDYSLEHLASRPAAVGDKLVTTKFGQSFTRGFCSVYERRVPVCMQPGTELAFDRDIKVQASFRLFPARSLGTSVARFCRVNEDKPYRHHDALELPTGQVVLLTSLCEKQRATVIQLPVTERQPAQQASPSVGTPIAS